MSAAAVLHPPRDWSSSGPRTRTAGFRVQASMAVRTSACSRRWIVPAPTRSLSWKITPQRIDSRIAGVPDSSRWAMLSEYSVSKRMTKSTVPPPGWVGTEKRASAFLSTRPL